MKRLNNPGYGFQNSRVVDQYIYNYLMTDEQRAQCQRSPHTDNLLIIASDSYHEVVRGMCAYVFEDACKGPHVKSEDRGKLTAYCERYLETVDDAARPLPPRSVADRLQEAKEAVVPPLPGIGAREADAR